MKRHGLMLGWQVLLLTFCLFPTAPGAWAATNTWTGADPSGNWSAPANWSPTGVPVNGNDLVFPGGLPPADSVSTNDLPDSFFRSITFNQGSGHTLRGNAITLTNNTRFVVNRGTNVIACDVIFTATPAPGTSYFSWPSIGLLGLASELTVSGNIQGSYLNVSGGRLVLQGEFAGGRMFGYGGTQVFQGDHAHALSVTNMGGVLQVQGSQPNLNLTMLWEMESAACASLSGDGLVGDITGCGHITPDSTLSVKNLGHHGGWGGLDIRLNGTNVGEYGRLVATGNVRLSSGRLLPSAGFNPQPGQVFTIVEKISPGPIANAFLGPEGRIITLNAMPFRLSYVGGDGNDVTLTAAPPRLNVTRTSDPAQVRLSWSTNYPGFRLERASPLDSSAPWLFQNAPQSPVVIGGDYTITTPTTTNHEFFRLKRE